MHDANYVVFDIETTGGNPSKNGLTEICAFKYYKGEIQDTFYTMVNPKVRIPPIVRKMTGINQQMVKDAPTAKEVMPGFMEFIKDSIMVSHNTLGDLKFLKHFAIKYCSQDIENFFLCTHLLSERLVPEAKDKSLTGLGGHFNLAFSEKHHRAKADALLTIKLFDELVKLLQSRSIQKLSESIRLQGDLDSGVRLGWEVAQKDIDAIPKACGVLRFFDKDEHLLFSLSSQDMKRDIHKIRNLASNPKRIARALLRANSVKYETFDNILEAFDAEALDEITYQLKISGDALHGRVCSALNLEEFESGTRVYIGSPSANTKAAFGKVIDKKRIQAIVVELVGRYGHKSKKKGFHIQDIEPILVKQLLLGKKAELKESFSKNSWLTFLSKKKKERQKTVLKYLSLIPEPLTKNKLIDYFDLNGLVFASTTEDSYAYYPVVNGTVVISEKRSTGENIETFLSNQKNIKTFLSSLEHLQHQFANEDSSERYYSRTKASLWILDGCWPDSFFHGCRYIGIESLKNKLQQTGFIR